MFGFKTCNYVPTRRLTDRIERIHWRYPGPHLSPKEIAYSVLGAINIVDESNWSSLHYAAYLGMEKTCFELITSGADLNKTNAWGDTPLHLACRMSNFNCIEAILQFKPKINIRNDMLSTPLSIFISRPPKNEYILKTLLEAGADPDIFDENGYSPLHVLAIQVETEKTKIFARLLVEYKANVDSVNEFEETPLHLAVNARNIGLIEVLVETDASINIPDISGKTVMDIALDKRTRYPRVFECLAKHLIIQYCCGFSVNLRYLEEVCDNEKYQNFKKTCEEEIKLLKSTLAGDSTVTYYDILVSPTHRVARYLFNSDILDSLVELDVGSSILGSRLLKKFNAAFKRYNAMKLGIAATRKMFPFLPDLCIDKLMENLNIDDFNNLYKASSLQLEYRSKSVAYSQSQPSDELSYMLMLSASLL